MVLIALVALVIGLMLILAGNSARSCRGLSKGRTTDLDNRTLYSSRFGLAGRPDRIMEGVIPEEWKSGDRVYDSHRAQLGVNGGGKVQRGAGADGRPKWATPLV